MIDVKYFVVAVAKAQLLIGLQTSQDLELISINNNVSAVIAKETEILDKYQDVFAGHGLVDGKFHIGLCDDAKPTIHPPTKISLSLMPLLSALKQVLERARWRNIKFNRSKVQLCVNQVKYLGDMVTADGFKPDPEKTKTIINMPELQNKQDLQHLLGMVNYLLQYIPNMSEITPPSCIA